MKLDYSFGGISPILFLGDLPFPSTRNEKVKVAISGAANGPFPPVFEIADLLCYRRESSKESGIVLLFEYHAGNNPPATTIPPLGQWYPSPGFPRIGQIRVALTKEAVGHIRKNAGNGYDHELELRDVELNDVTPKKVSENSVG